MQKSAGKAMCAATVGVAKFDFVVIGSGFGGSVSAYRLAQKGYSVAVIETGKRWSSLDFPKTNWNVGKFLWLPALRFFGFQRLSFLRGLTLLHGVGVGGGSLVYANTLMEPADAVLGAPEWPKHVKWADELKSFFAEAKRMLGVTVNPKLFASELALKALSKKMNVEDTFHPTEVGVFFGTPGITVADPYFGGEGPPRSGCNFCGGCMVGCRFGAKNTLDKNYLFLAERHGAHVFPETTATRISKCETQKCYVVETKQATSFLRKKSQTFFADRLVLAAGVLGTLRLLFLNRDHYKTLPYVSQQLGKKVRTNGESLLGATQLSSNDNFSEGIAIGAAIHPDSVTKIEAVKYAQGSDFMRMLAVPLTGRGGRVLRPLKLVVSFFSNFRNHCRVFLKKDWSASSVILLVMQTLDQKMELKLGRSALFPFRKSLKCKSKTTLDCYSETAQRAASLLAKEIQGVPQNVIPEVLLGAPVTAHVLGGCCLGESQEHGVVDASHEVFGHSGLYVCDGSVIPSNLGVNPSLTIAAMAERFAALFPEKSRTTVSDSVTF